MLAHPQEKAAQRSFEIERRSEIQRVSELEPVHVPPANETTRPNRVADLAILSEAIRADAEQDTVHYLLRSNTSHDGE